MGQRKYKFIESQSELVGVLDNLMSKPMWGYDVETTGIDPHNDEIILMQIGRGFEGYVIDTRKVNVQELNPFLESKTIKKVAHNALFEVKMTRGKTGARCNTMRCSMIAEKLLTNGGVNVGLSLEDVTKKRLNIIRDKTLQKSFIGHTGPFSEAQLLYAEEDVWYMDEIIKQQSAEMAAARLGGVFVIECNAIPVFADMEFDGIPFDADSWRGLIYENKKLLKSIHKQLDDISGMYVTSNMFDGLDINYNSPAQVLQIINKLGIVDNLTGKPITFSGTSEKHLKDYKDIQFVQLLEKYRETQKAISTYGDSYIAAINAKTERIHPEFWSLGTDTGRPSSRGAVNILTIPKDVRYRRCFRAPPGYLMQTDDFSGCEPRILADLSNDQFLKKVFNEGKDVHCEIASFLFNTPVAKNEDYAKKFNIEYDKNNVQYRVPGKRLNLGITYGQGVESLYSDINAEGFSITKENTKALLFKYRSKLSAACNYIKRSGYDAVNNGLIRNMNGRVRYYNVPIPENFKMGKEDPGYKKQLGSIIRSGGNFPIQSVCSDMVKVCMAKIREYALDNKIHVSIVNCIYDEIVTMTREEDSESFHREKVKIMRGVAEDMIKTVPMPVDGVVGKYWGG